MEKRMIIAIFSAYLILSASTSTVPVLLNETFQNTTSNMTIQHNNRFVFLIPALAPAISALASALGIAAAGTAAVGAGVVLGHVIDEAIHSGGGSSSGGSSKGLSTIKTYDEFVLKSTAVIKPITQQLALAAVSLTVLKLFNICDLFRVCSGVNPGVFGPKMYLGILVEKGQCPKFRFEVNPVTASALIQFPSACNKECCMLKKNILPESCFDKNSSREGQCMLQCSDDKMEIDNSMGCDKGRKCCGHRQTVLLG